MSWSEIRGHGHLEEAFRQAAAANRLASTFLFVGPPGIGKRTFALKLAESLLCQNSPEHALQPCGSCSSCVQVRALSHPDLEVISKPADKSTIPVELLLGSREHRRQEGLCHWIGLRPSVGNRKIAILDDADHLNQEGANCLLKTLEEPPPGALIILIGSSQQRQLPTIRSRSQIIRFAPLKDEEVAQLLIEKQLVETAEEANRIASRGEGSLSAALNAADEQLWEVRSELWQALHPRRLAANELTAWLTKLVDAAGTDNEAKRNRLRHLLEFATIYYRQLLRQLTGCPESGDPQLQAPLSQAVDAWPGDAEDAAACLSRTAEALAQVGANANRPTLISCWCDDLELILRGNRLEVPSW